MPLFQKKDDEGWGVLHVIRKKGVLSLGRNAPKKREKGTERVPAPMLTRKTELRIMKREDRRGEGPREAWLLGGKEEEERKWTSISL